MEAGPSFKCSLQGSKQKFYAASNSIFAKLGVDSNLFNVVLSLVDSCSVSTLLYGLEALGIKKAGFDTIDFVYDSIFAKIFNIREKCNIRQCQYATGFLPVSLRLDIRILNFYEGLKFNKSGSMAANLFCLLDDRVYHDTLLKYNISDSVLRSHNFKHYKGWKYFSDSL